MALSTRLDTVHHIQSVASTTWVIVHNLNTVAPVVDCWVDNGGDQEKIIPVTVAGTDANTCTITFSAARTGEAAVA